MKDLNKCGGSFVWRKLQDLEIRGSCSSQLVENCVLHPLTLHPPIRPLLLTV